MSSPIASPDPSARGHRRTLARDVASAAAGIVVAVALLEGALRLFESPVEPPRPRILADALTAPAVDRRQLDEGVSIAHFSITGARMTGHAPQRDGRVVVVLGDSYVMAREVADRETMGGQLEDIARAAGTSINVRQYGWWGASPAQYLLVAPAIRRRWGPAEVVVILSENDLDGRVNQSSPRLQLGSANGATIVGSAADTIAGPPLPSTLWMLVQHRWATLRRHAPAWTRRARPSRPPVALPSAITPAAPVPSFADSTDIESPPASGAADQMPDVVVRALARAYGHQLSIVYLADVGVDGGESATVAESRLLDACRGARVRCLSTRSAMLDLRRRGRVGQGLATRDIGKGHLNADGHRVVAIAMWSMLDSTRFGATAAR